MQNIEKLVSEDKDLKFLREAYRYAWKYSKDPSTATGVVIVKEDRILVWGANYAPEGVIMTPEILGSKEKPSKLKYEYIEHAERVAIAKAAKYGIELRTNTIYSPWFPCAPCARAIINAGIMELVTHKELQELSEKLDLRWGESQQIAKEMLTQSGVFHRDVSKKIGDDISIRFKYDVYHL
jgi:deoxycytidylate deaminase